MTFYEPIKIGGMRNFMLSQFLVSIGPGRPSHPPWKAYFAAENTLLRQKKPPFFTLHKQNQRISLVRPRVPGSGRVRRPVKAFLDEYHLLSLDKDVADLSASLRRKHGWRLPDAFQAALCLHHNIRFSTRNTKDFNPRKHPFVEIPYIL
jgi:hypothetical protein